MQLLLRNLDLSAGHTHGVDPVLCKPTERPSATTHFQESISHTAAGEATAAGSGGPRPTAAQGKPARHSSFLKMHHNVN